MTNKSIKLRNTEDSDEEIEVVKFDKKKGESPPVLKDLENENESIDPDLSDSSDEQDDYIKPEEIKREVSDDSNILRLSSKVDFFEEAKRERLLTE